LLLVLLEWINRISEAVYNIENSIKSVVKTLFGLSAAINSALNDSIKHGVSLEHFSFDVSGFLDPLTEAGLLGDFERNIVETVGNAMAGLPSLLYPVVRDLKALWDATLPVIKQGTDIVVDAFKYLRNISKDVYTGLGTIVSSLIKIYESAQPLIGIFLMIFGGPITKIFATIGVIIAFRKELIKLLTEPEKLVDQLSRNITTRLNNIVTAIQSIYFVVKNAFMALVPESYVNKFLDVFSKFETQISTTYNTLAKTLSETRELVSSFLKNMFSFINEKLGIFDFN